MAKRLYSFPIDAEDEAESVSALLTEHNIEHYISPGSRWGFSRSSFWIKNNDDIVEAKKLFEQHATEYARKAREEYQASTGYNPDASRGERFQFFMRHLRHRKAMVVVLVVFLFLIYQYVKLFFNFFSQPG